MREQPSRLNYALADVGHTCECARRIDAHQAVGRPGAVDGPALDQPARFGVVEVQSVQSCDQCVDRQERSVALGFAQLCQRIQRDRMGQRELARAGNDDP